MDMKQLSPTLFTGAQIALQDLDTLAREGFTDVVCNRPDSEHTGPFSRTMATRAAELGLAFHYRPITPGEPPLKQARALAHLTGRPGARVFAYCRSGARSSMAWAIAQAEQAGADQQV